MSERPRNLTVTILERRTVTRTIRVPHLQLLHVSIASLYIIYDELEGNVLDFIPEDKFALFYLVHTW